MKLRLSPFNIYFVACLVLLTLGLAGCASSEESKKKKEEAVVQLYLEAEFDTGDKTQVIPVYRAAPVPIRVFKQPFLDSASLTEAAVVDAVGGFAIVLRFDFHGILALETTSTSYKGNRLAVLAEWPESRWLAAPRMTTRITDGSIIFTPDASREEAERIVRGLNNVAVKLGNRPKQPSKVKKEDK